MLSCAIFAILYCSFCGKSQHEARKLIVRPAVFICVECVELCIDLQGIQRKLAIQGDEMATDSDISALPPHLKDKNREEVVALQQKVRCELKRYEDALRVATTVLSAGNRTGSLRPFGGAEQT